MAEKWIVIGTFQRPEEVAFYQRAIESHGVRVLTASAAATEGLAPTHLLVVPGDAERAGWIISQHWRPPAEGPPAAASGDAPAARPSVIGEQSCYCPRCGRHQWFAYWKVGTMQSCRYCQAYFVVPFGFAVRRDGPLESPALPALPQATSVPRRFSIGAMMAMVALFGIVFATMSSLNAPPEVFAVVTVLFAGVAVAQPLLFQGQRPREASILAGGVVLPIATAVALAVSPSVRVGPAEIIPAVICCIPSGLLFGYCTGTLAAGVFLLMERLAQWRAARSEADDEDEQDAEDQPAASTTADAAPAQVATAELVEQPGDLPHSRELP